MKIAIFSHGKESGPNGEKINIMRKVASQHGYETFALDYTTCANAQARVALLKDFISRQEAAPIVLVGSSMGGYVSTVVANDHEVQGLFLLCPALYMPFEEYAVQSYHPRCPAIEMIHGWDDDIVPYENSIRFGKQTRATVNLIHDGHRLQNSYAFIENRFDAFLQRLEQR